MSDCIFCMIKEGKIPSSTVYEDDKILVFNDVDPQAPVHMLMIPKKHISSLNETSEEDEALLGYMMNKVRDVAKLAGLDNGYRVVINCGEDGMQTVFHIHVHILGKRKMLWPPG